MTNAVASWRYNNGALGVVVLMAARNFAKVKVPVRVRSAPLHGDCSVMAAHKIVILAGAGSNPVIRPMKDPKLSRPRQLSCEDPNLYRRKPVGSWRHDGKMWIIGTTTGRFSTFAGPVIFGARGVYFNNMKQIDAG